MSDSDQTSYAGRVPGARGRAGPPGQVDGL